MDYNPIGITSFYFMQTTLFGPYNGATSVHFAEIVIYNCRESTILSRISK